MYWKTPRRLIRRLGLALAVAAFAAPAAQAMPVINQEGGNASSPRVYADDLHASAPQAPVLIRAYPDDVVRPLSSGPVSNVSHRTYPDDMVRPLASTPAIDVSTRNYPDDMVRSLASEPVSNFPAGNGPTDSLGRPLSQPNPTDSLGRPLGQPDLTPPPSDVVSDSTRIEWTHVGVGFFAIGLMFLGGALIISKKSRRGRLAAA
jgi:hypothetical protein